MYKEINLGIILPVSDADAQAVADALDKLRNEALSDPTKVGPVPTPEEEAEVAATLAAMQQGIYLEMLPSGEIVPAGETDISLN